MGYVCGNHPSATPEQTQRLRAMLAGHRKAFAFTMSELTGYQGPLGPVAISLVHNHPIWEPSRRLSPLEQK
jgi:hypothetical protein